MTEGESAILEVMRKHLQKDGHRVDALTGDGLLVRPNEDFGPRQDLKETLQSLEAAVTIATGYKVTLTGKTLDGNKTSQWCDDT